jgi:hypothetical protein
MLTRTAIDPGLLFASPQRHPLMSFGPGRACSWSVFQDRCLVRPESPSTRRGILRSGGRRLQKGDAPDHSLHEVPHPQAGGPTPVGR